MTPGFGFNIIVEIDEGFTWDIDLWHVRSNLELSVAVDGVPYCNICHVWKEPSIVNTYGMSRCICDICYWWYAPESYVRSAALIVPKRDCLCADSPLVVEALNNWIKQKDAIPVHMIRRFACNELQIKVEEALAPDTESLFSTLTIELNISPFVPAPIIPIRCCKRFDAGTRHLRVVVRVTWPTLSCRNGKVWRCSYGNWEATHWCSSAVQCLWRRPKSGCENKLVFKAFVARLSRNNFVQRSGTYSVPGVKIVLFPLVIDFLNQRLRFRDDALDRHGQHFSLFFVLWWHFTL